MKKNLVFLAISGSLAFAANASLCGDHQQLRDDGYCYCKKGYILHNYECKMCPDYSFYDCTHNTCKCEPHLIWDAAKFECKPKPVVKPYVPIEPKPQAPVYNDPINHYIQVTQPKDPILPIVPSYPQAPKPVQKPTYVPEPPKVEPPKPIYVPEPPKIEPPKVEPPKVEPPKPIYVPEPPKVQPPKPIYVPEPPKVEPPKVEPPKVEPPKVEPPKVEPPKVEPPKVEPPKEHIYSPEPEKPKQPSQKPLPPPIPVQQYPPSCGQNEIFVLGQCRCRDGFVRHFGKECVSCPGNSFLNPPAYRCDCPYGQKWNDKRDFCIDACGVNEIFVNGSCRCRDGFVKHNGDICVTCPSGSYLNPPAFRCDCIPGLKWNKDRTQCTW